MDKMGLIKGWAVVRRTKRGAEWSGFQFMGATRSAARDAWINHMYADWSLGLAAFNQQKEDGSLRIAKVVVLEEPRK